MPSLVHFWFDNFDLQEETPSEKGTTHSTHGLICQEKVNVTNGNEDGIGYHDDEEDADVDKENVDPPEVKSKVLYGRKLRSIKHEISELPPCYVKKSQIPPKFDVSQEYKEDNIKVIKAHNSDLLWLLTRRIYFQPHKDLPQRVPGWKGWVSCTGKRNTESLTTIEYLPPIPAPITENSTVQECLIQSQTMTNALQQC